MLFTEILFRYSNKRRSIVETSIDDRLGKEPHEISMTVLFSVAIFMVFHVCSGWAQQVSIEVVTDKSQYYADEKLFVLVRAENRTMDSVYITTGRMTGSDKESGYIYCLEIEVGTAHAIRYPDWKNVNLWVPPGKVEYRMRVLPLYRDGKKDEPVVVPLTSGDYNLRFEFIVEFEQGRHIQYITQSNIEVLEMESKSGQRKGADYWWSKLREEDPARWRTELEELLQMQPDAPYKNTLMYIVSDLLLHNKEFRRSYMGMTEGDPSIASRTVVMQWVLNNPSEFSTIICLEALSRYLQSRLMICQEMVRKIPVNNKVVVDYMLHSFCR